MAGGRCGGHSDSTERLPESHLTASYSQLLASRNALDSSLTQTPEKHEQAIVVKVEPKQSNTCQKKKDIDFILGGF